MNSRPISQDYGKRLLPRLIDQKAEYIPNHTYARYAASDWEENGYRTMTWKQYGDSINKLAYWLDQQLDKSIDLGTIAYLGGPNDLKYAILLLAAIKTNRRLLIPDGRITKSGIASIIAETNCAVWLFSEDTKHQTDALGIKETGIQLLKVPSTEWCIEAEGTEHYPYNDTYEECKTKDVAIIHTSGTTGTPRPIYQNHGYYGSFDACNILSRNHWPTGITCDAWMKKRILSPCPPQWLAGKTHYVISPVFHNTVAVILPEEHPSSSLSNQQLAKIITENLVDGITGPPAFIAQLYNDVETQQLLKSLDFVTYLGAPLEKSIGDDLCEHVKLTPIIGSTETGSQPSLLARDRKLWYTHDFCPEYNNRFELIPGSGAALDHSEDLYELIHDRPADGKDNIFQAAWWNTTFKEQPRLETKELYKPIKDLDGRTRWAFVCRKDDFTKLAWLAKFNAQDIEAKIQRHPAAQAVLVGGEGRPVPYVIIEPKHGALEDNSPEELLDEIYGTISEQVAKELVDELQIPRETVLLASEDRPFKLSNKLTILRREVEKDYQAEIDKAYQKFESAT